MTSIGGSAFYNCSGLTSITIPNSVTSIGRYAFYGCSGLTSITIPNSVTSIGSSAFEGCSSLTSITIPNSVTSIGSGAFRGCSSLTSMIVEEGNTVYDSRENCNAIIVTATNTLFFGCQSTVIPNSVTIIRMSAFEDCSSLTSITIPNSVTSIVDYAFRNCEKLTDVYCYAEKVPSTGNYAFSDSPIEYATLHVLESAIENYKTTVPWSGFGTIVALTDKDPSVVNVPHMNEQLFSVHSHDGTITISGGLTDGTAVTVYSTSGMTMGSTTAEGGRASVSTSLQAGDVAIVNIGSKKIKVVMK